MRRIALFSALVLAVAMFSVFGAASARPRLGFAKPFLIDPTRAGGEPGIFQLTVGKHAGEYLYASHAGTTQIWRGGLANMGDYLKPYRNQTYMWRSSDAHRWKFIQIDHTGLHSTGTGFSDRTSRRTTPATRTRPRSTWRTWP